MPHSGYNAHRSRSDRATLIQPQVTSRDFFERNWQLYKNNKRLYNSNKQNYEGMAEIINGLGVQLGGVFMETPQGQFENHQGNTVLKQNKLSMENVELYAYIHYFIAKQNRKKSYEQLPKIFENACELTEHMSGEDWKEAHMKGVAEDEMRKYNNMKDMLENLDKENWWGMRTAGSKLWKLYAD